MDRDDIETPERRPSAQRGASLVEYALLLALIAILCVVALGVLGGEVNGIYGQGASMYDA